MMKPLGNYCIVKPEVESDTTKSGIIIEKQPDGNQVGEVLQVAKEGEVKVGDKVVYKKYSADKVKVDGDEYLFIDVSDIIAIYEV